MSWRNWVQLQLPRIWLSRGPWARLLSPVSGLYKALLVLHRLSYRLGLKKATQLPVCVVVVGNVVAGGAGKTPLTIALAQHLTQQGRRVGVISRGYGRTGHDTRAVYHDSPPHSVGDEPLLIRQKTGLPVWVGRARADAGQALLQQHPDVDTLICDDGLQHGSLARDIDICVMDERGIGNGWLLPAGPLRQPWPARFDLLLHTGPNGLPGGFQAQRRLANVAHNGHGETRTLTDFHKQSVHAVAGLARPEAFFQMLRDAGLQLQTTTALPDHFDYAQWPAMALNQALLCTEKDAVKLWAHQPQAWAVPLTLTPEPAFWQALDALLKGRHPG